MKKIQILLAALLMMPLAMFSEGWDNQLYKQIESRIVAPTFPDATFNITKYGASPKASAAQNQKAINKAIELCSKKGGGKVVVPAGIFVTGAITLKSNVNLVVSKEAVLKFAFDSNLYPLVYTRWEGLDCYNYSPCFHLYCCL